MGTTAWRKSYRRRNVVEGVNAMLKGGFVNLQQKFFRVFRLTKLTFLLASTIAGYNVECIRSFNARKVAEAEATRGEEEAPQGAPAGHVVASPRRRRGGQRPRSTAGLIRTASNHPTA